MCVVAAQDPREALILSLKREVAALQSENDHLRSALRLNGELAGGPGGPGGPGAARAIGEPSSDPPSRSPCRRCRGPTCASPAAGSPPAVDLDRLAELEANELSGLVQHYMQENEALRRENSELFSTRDILMRDQDMVCRENERLLKKLEDVNS